MFAALPHPTHLPLQNRFHYMPARSSPLAPRDANYSSRVSMTMSASSSPSPKPGIFTPHTENLHNAFAFNTTPDDKTNIGIDQENTPRFQFGNSPINNAKSSTYAQRYVSQFSNPASKVAARGSTSASESARAKRRDMFLNRVKRDREAGKLDARGEQFMMMEHMAEQKQWGETMSRDADGILREYGLEDEEEVKEGDVRDDADVYALDEYISQEHEMEEALEELVPQNVLSSPRSERGSFYGDDDYDDIFMDLADHIDGTRHVQPSQDMDMSSG